MNITVAEMMLRLTRFWPPHDVAGVIARLLKDGTLTVHGDVGGPQWLSEADTEVISAALTASATTPRPLSTIAQEIRVRWETIPVRAEVYVTALDTLTGMGDLYGVESARDVVLGFLANGGSWRGPAARRIKQELADMAGIKRRTR